MTDYVKSLKINSVSHPVLGKALENCNTSAGAVKDLKVWQGTAEEFQNQTCDLYAWSRAAASGTQVATSAAMNALPTQGMGTSCGTFVLAGPHRVGSDFTVQNTGKANCGYAWTGSKVIAMLSSSTANVFTSTDGITWTDTGVSIGVATRSAVYFNGKVITNKGYYSTDDGQTWTAPSTTLTGDYMGVADDIAFISATSVGIWISTNGTTWTQADTANMWVDCKVNGTYYAHRGTSLYTSTNGINWTQTSYTMPYTAALVPALMHEGSLWIWSAKGSVWSSTDLTNWKLDFEPTVTYPSWTPVLNAFGHPLIWLNRQSACVLVSSSDDIYTATQAPSVGDCVFKETVQTTKITETTPTTITHNFKEYSRNSSKDITRTAPACFVYPHSVCLIDGGVVAKDSDVFFERPLTTEEELKIATGSFLGIDIEGGSLFNTKSGTKIFSKHMRSRNNLTPFIDGSAYIMIGGYSSTSSEYTTIALATTRGTGYYSEGLNFNSWTPFTSLSQYDIYTAVGATDKYVATGYKSSSNDYHILFSSDGTTWSSVLSRTVTPYGILANNTSGRFVAVYDQDSAYCSSGGSTWTSATGMGSASFHCTGIVYGDNKFVAVGSGEDNCYYSTDGSSWTKATLTLSGTAYKRICYGKNTYVVYDASTHKLHYSADGINWTSSMTPTFSDKIADIVFKNNYFYAMTTKGNFYVSQDGISWEHDYAINDQFTSTTSATYLGLSSIPSVGDLLFVRGPTTMSVFSLAQGTRLLPSQVGYDGRDSTSSIQTLKQYKGTLQWVTDATT